MHSMSAHDTPMIAASELAAAHPIASSKAAAMSYLSLLVSMGHVHWHRGEVRPDKALGFVSKMYSIYPELALKETARMRVKSKGRANIRLVIYPDLLRPEVLQWWLLATPGSGLVFERERMKDVRDHPLLWLDQYQIQRITSTYRPSGKTKQQRTTWSWTLQPVYRAELRDLAKSYCDASVESAKPAMYKLFERLRRMPMFSGIRDDLQALDAFAKGTWNKKHRTHPYVSHVQALPYMTRIKVFEGLNLAALVEEMLAAQAAAKAQARELAQRALSDEDAPVYLTQSLISRSRNGTEKEVLPATGDLFPADSSGIAAAD